MSFGQNLALIQLTAIQEADPHAVEILRVIPPEKEGEVLCVHVTLHCGCLERVAGGLPLRERERFHIFIPADFPFVRPEALVPHVRFAGWPHVQWKRSLCLYLAPETEWDPADGMFGFMDRLWIWLCHGALNELNPTGQPIHPPVTYTKPSASVVVPRFNTPKVSGNTWLGFALLHAAAENRLDVVGWHSLTEEKAPPTLVAPTVLLNRALSWEMPGKLDSVLSELEAGGLPRETLIILLHWAIVLNAKDQPLLVIIGTPQRGVTGTSDLRQHLMAWQISAGMVDGLRLSLEKYSDHPKLRELGERAQAIVLEWAKVAEVNWCRVLEDRPEVTVRRDYESPLAVFHERAVCVWGCGALGSHVAYFLAKAGVRRLVLIDRGIVTPGLLVRQFFEDADIGTPKADALRRHLLQLRPGLEVEAYCANMLHKLAPDHDWTYGADFVIDCTASDVVHAKLEHILCAGCSKRAPIISMIIGHRAERGICVVVSSRYTGGPKDLFRKAKLRACRVPSLADFVNDFYPQEGELHFFQPEPGCSDATFRGSAADVAALTASMLNFGAKSLGDASPAAQACFVSHPRTANVRSGQAGFWVEHCEEDLICGGTYEIRIAPAALKEMTAWIKRARRAKGREVETGGLLFGKRNDAIRIIWIDDVTGPPPDSVCSATSFVCGTEGTSEAHARRRSASRGSVEFVGMWHTHPEDAPMPSSTDFEGMVHLLSAGELPPTKCLLLIVGWPNRHPVLGVALFDRQGSSQAAQRIVAEVSLTPVSTPHL